jgi:ABC-type polar amino acid transport system ATPase subunit
MIQLKNVSKSYGAVQVLTDVDLRQSQGQWLCMLKQTALSSGDFFMCAASESAPS